MGFCKLKSEAQLYKKKRGRKIMTKRFGFTLAEVLITLGIIGVVAAMTIPTLISNTNGAQFKSAYKKALSSLNQAVLMNVAMEDTDFSTLKADTATGTAEVTKGSLGAMLEQRLQSATDITATYFDNAGTAAAEGEPKTLEAMTYHVEHVCTAADGTPTGSPAVAPIPECVDNEGETVEIDKTAAAPTAATWRVYALADGTVFGYLKGTNGAANCSAPNEKCIGFIDVNGDTAPNTTIKCDSGEEVDDACEVSNANVKDIYPVVFHGQTVEPANDAARTVLFGK